MASGEGFWHRVCCDVASGQALFLTEVELPPAKSIIQCSSLLGVHTKHGGCVSLTGRRRGERRSYGETEGLGGLTAGRWLSPDPPRVRPQGSQSL